MLHTWDFDKNTFLKEHRNISFERIIIAIEQGDLIDILEHPDQSKYDGQKLYVVLIENYCWVISFKDNEDKSIRKLITAFPSRKLTRKYLP